MARLSQTYYEMKRTSLYSSLCSSTSLQRDNQIRKEIEKLEQEWEEQNNIKSPIVFELEKKRKMGKKK